MLLLKFILIDLNKPSLSIKFKMDSWNLREVQNRKRPYFFILPEKSTNPYFELQVTAEKNKMQFFLSVNSIFFLILF